MYKGLCNIEKVLLITTNIVGCVVYHHDSKLVTHLVAIGARM